MDMRSYIMECLERHLSDYDLDGVELTEEDVDAVERQIIKNGLTLNNAVETVLLGISNCWMEMKLVFHMERKVDYYGRY